MYWGNKKPGKEMNSDLAGQTWGKWEGWYENEGRMEVIPVLNAKVDAIHHEGEKRLLSSIDKM